MTIPQELFEYALAPNMWDYNDDILYAMCKNDPYHTDPAVISGKMNIIGRSYAAAIERRKNARDTQGDFYQKYVVPTLLASDIDARINNLRMFTQIEKQNLKAVLGTHKYLVDIFYKIIHQNKRSLASKYLHFHLPNLFFLYDSQAQRGLRKLKPRLSVNRVVGDFDEEYNVFCLKLLTLREEIERDYGRILTPRQIDRMLLRVAEQT